MLYAIWKDTEQFDWSKEFSTRKDIGFPSEIWFMISPELLVSRLLTEQLDGNEFLSIVGCEKFNAYSSYAANFQWTTDYTDKTPRDE